MRNEERRPTIKILEKNSNKSLNNPTEELQEMFDELDPNQKADFIKNNIAWTRTCDLRDELKLRHEL